MTSAIDPRLALLDTESPGGARLAELASFAVRVDAGLLRRLRQTLLPDADVGAESDLWFSAIVESRSESGFQIAPEVNTQLRDRLVSEPGRPAVALVRAILREAHAEVSPAIRLEEEINGIALQMGEAGRPAIDEALRPALATLGRGGAEAVDVARWAVHAIPRLHPIVRDTPNARTLVLSAALLLRRRARLGRALPGPDVRIASLGWALPKTVRSERIGVELLPGGLQFRAWSGSVGLSRKEQERIFDAFAQPNARPRGDSTGLGLSMARQLASSLGGDATAEAEPGRDNAGFIDVPTTEPVLVEVEWESPTGPRSRLTPAVPGVVLALDGSPRAVTITTLLGDQFRVTATLTNRQATEWNEAWPSSELLAACVQLEPLGHPEPICVAFAVTPTILVSVSEIIGGYPILGVSGDVRQVSVLRLFAHDGGARLGAVSLVSGPTSMPVTLAPAGERGWEPDRGAAVGFVNGSARWFNAVLEPLDSSQGAARKGVLFDVPNLSANEIQAAFVGAPIVAGGRSVGAIVGISPPQGGETYATIEVAAAATLRAVVERARSVARPNVDQPTRPAAFISYTGADREAAQRVHDALTARGIDVRRFGEMYFEAGVPWEEQLKQGMQGVSAFIFLLSRGAIEKPSNNLSTEWGIATGMLSQLTRGEPFLVPIVIDDLSFSDPRIPSFMRDVVMLRARNGDLSDRDLDRIVERVGRATGDIAAETTTVGEVDELDLTQLLAPEMLRSAIRDVLFSDKERVLIVNGSRQSPITEVGPLVEQARLQARTELTSIELSAVHAGYSATQLADEIAVTSGLDTGEMPRREDWNPRASRTLAVWLVSALERSGPRVLTLQGFDDFVFGEELLDFVSELIGGVVESTGALRLILVNFTRRMPVRRESAIRRVTLEPVGPAHVQQYFTTLFQRTGRAFEPAATEQATESVFASLPGDTWEYGDLRRRLAEAARLLAREQA
jgi:hypothetical protein